MFAPGDICIIDTKYGNHGGIVRISKVLAGISLYEFETTKDTQRCHTNSILSSNFRLIASNTTSLDEVKSLYPEYFI